MGRGRKVCARAVGPACLASGSESGHVRGGVAVGGAGAPGAPVGLGGGAPWSSACGTFTERRQGGDRLGSSAPADFTLSTYRVTGRGRAGQGPRRCPGKFTERERAGLVQHGCPRLERTCWFMYAPCVINR